MSLHQILFKQVDAGVRHRGEGYYATGRVKIKNRDGDYLDASVKGTRRYTVTLKREEGKLISACTCPYFEGGVACKHIWATILTADAHQLLQPSREEKNIQLVTSPDPEHEAYLDEMHDVGRIAAFAAPAKSHGGLRPRPLHSRSHAAPRQHSWKQIFSTISSANPPETRTWPPDREIIYQFDAGNTINNGLLSLSILYRQPKQNGEWSKQKPLRLNREEIPQIPDPRDRTILTILGGPIDPYSSWGNYESTVKNEYVMPDSLRDIILPLLCQTGRCFLFSPSTQNATVLRLDEGNPWTFRLEVVSNESASRYLVRGFLERGEERQELNTPILILAGGWIFSNDHVARLNDSKAFGWISLLRRVNEIAIPLKDAHEIPSFLYSQPNLPPLTLPADLQYREVNTQPKPCLMIMTPRYPGESFWVWADLRFDYGDTIIPEQEPSSFAFLAEQRTVIRRDMAAENSARQTLSGMGLKCFDDPDLDARWQLPLRNLTETVSALITQNWRVEAKGRLYRKPGTFKINVTSEVDWFELRGSMDFDGITADIPALLKAIKNGENTILLSDGTIGMLPEEWLKKCGTLASLGSENGDHMRFTRNQAGVLDAMLAAQPEATCDEIFRKLRAELQSFEAIQPVDPSPDFTGTLRDYQKDGMGWLCFLQRFNFGGCLADDMGLGKTVQVLAMLESRRLLRAAVRQTGSAPVGPSLVVVPRSLVFNWQQEALRFTPKMRIMDYTGIKRKALIADFEKCDLILTTYGTLRSDIEQLKNVTFDYVILDEAQAIKNADAQTAKSARLLKCRYRLAMSGTPIQNHLGELWSLLEFLNPGMLGKASVFRLTEAGGRTPAQETRELLARAIKPFILRRTKAQVAKDLPERTEETLYCELDKTQRKLYNELRDHYRLSLKTKIDREGINKSKIMILEALLRLRQVACHPGLIDIKRSDEPSAKLDVLLPQLAEVMEEDHKALVFSQFTSFLTIVRKQLDAAGIRYEYLDGHTRDREARVRNFQEDPDSRLFLISLKAGGLGLNLTAAEYVFLLDPWWNPSVEAQAIDRAHRIGQARKVFAYRLIARDTVEEKVLELQKTKKDLADSIINADNSLIRTLSRDDLELLLG